MERLLKSLNALFDSLTRPSLPWRGDEHPSYQVMGILGLFAGYVLAGALTVVAGLELWLLACLVLLACLLFLGQGMLYKIVLGYERLALLEQVPIILAAAAGLVALLGHPVLAYLDVFTLGLATALVFGRIGCHMAGCCHGRPHRLGVCYGQEYTREGLPHYYAGVRLFPIQLLEAAVTLVIVLSGLWLHLVTSQPGIALAWYVASYGCARFVIEFARGDSARSYLLGISLNQWICVYAVWLLLLAGSRGVFSHTPLLLGAAVALLGAVFYLLIFSWQQGGLPVRHPHHVADLYHALSLLKRRAADAGGQVVTARTSAGLLVGLSVAPDPGTGNIACHYSFSALAGALGRKQALEMGRLVAERHRFAGSLTLWRSPRGRFHMTLVQESDG